QKLPGQQTVHPPLTMPPHRSAILSEVQRALMSSSPAATAAMLAIGDELLSGRTKDKNIGQLAVMLFLAGIDLKAVRIVGDEEEATVEALNALRARHTYVFTSGGIGPTHDDITADAVSKAFGVPCLHDPLAMELLGAMY